MFPIGNQSTPALPRLEHWHASHWFTALVDLGLVGAWSYYWATSGGGKGFTLW